MIQKPTEKAWKDEAGMNIPIGRVTKLEKKKEKYAARLLEMAQNINSDLIDFKALMEEKSKEIFDEYMASFEVKKATKGNFTWFNFDRSIKLEVDINERIDFDSIMIVACQEKLNEFLSDNLSSNQEYFRELVNEAFSTSHGKLDTRKVLGLLKHKSKIRQKKYQEAMELLEKSIFRPSSKTYYKVSLKDSAGEYKQINLNFSSI